MPKADGHPLESYSEKEKVEYLSILSCLAAADGEVADEEIKALRMLSKLVGVESKGRASVFSAAENPASVDIEKYLGNLSGSDLRYSLLTDLFLIAYADDSLDDSEVREIDDICKKLKIRDDQKSAIKKYAEALHKAKDADGDSDRWKKLGGDVAAGLASAGVPIAAVAASGSVAGLSAAGITSGLAALGLGLGMTTGIGVAVAIGIGSYVGVHWLYNKITGD